METIKIKNKKKPLKILPRYCCFLYKLLDMNKICTLQPISSHVDIKKYDKMISLKRRLNIGTTTSMVNTIANSIFYFKNKVVRLKHNCTITILQYYILQKTILESDTSEEGRLNVMATKDTCTVQQQNFILSIFLDVLLLRITVQI